MCESFWTNFWTVMAGLCGAIVGSTIAYLFQHRLEKIKNTEYRKGMVYKYAIFLDRINSQSNLIYSSYLSAQKEIKLRHINLPAIVFTFPNFDLNDPAIDLVFLTEYKNMNIDLIANLMTIKDRFSLLVNMVGIRNNLHINELQPIFAKLQITHGISTENDIQNLIGFDLYGKLKSATDVIYEEIDYIMKNYRQIKDRLGVALKAISPKAKMIEFSDKKVA